ncbi:MAG: hypothetical protein KBC58_00415 [Flavobacterium sp.]|nr:hypothetical protein [Flavobacterium sp.]
MKKLILFLSVITLSYSCSSDDSNSSNSSNSFSNSMDYEFTITINGEVHKVKGNTTDGIPKGMVQSLTNYINNQCEVLQSGGQKVVILKINDVTAPNYISGQNLECQILLPNLLLGTNEATILFSGGYFDTIASNLGAYSSPGSGTGFSYFQSISGPFNSTLSRKIPITINDLGTTSTNPNMWSPTTPLNFGQTLKGNYSGTIYLSSNSGFTNFNIPVQLSIDFKALRMY